MLPDGPERNSNTSGSLKSPESNGYQLFVEPSLFRERVGANPTQFHVWSDGTSHRETMRSCIVNKTEVRGWWLQKEKSVVFQWPFSLEHAHVQVHIDDKTGVLFPCTSREDLQLMSNAMRQDLSSTLYMAKIVVPMNGVVATLSSCTSMMSVRLVGCDEQRSMVTIQYEDDCAPNRTYDLPISKFLRAFFSPYKRPLALVTSIWTVLRCMLVFRRLHIRAQAKKYAPGGVGFKRALVSETALSMKRPCGPCGD